MFCDDYSGSTRSHIFMIEYTFISKIHKSFEKLQNMHSINWIYTFFGNGSSGLVGTGDMEAIKQASRLKFQMGSWVLWHTTVKINEHFIKWTPFNFKKLTTIVSNWNMILHHVKLGKHKCSKIAWTLKTYQNDDLINLIKYCLCLQFCPLKLFCHSWVYLFLLDEGLCNAVLTQNNCCEFISDDLWSI